MQGSTGDGNVSKSGEMHSLKRAPRLSSKDDYYMEIGAQCCSCFGRETS